MITTFYHLHADIWQEIFGYFGAMELISTFENVTNEADEVLFNAKYNLQLRGALINSSTKDLPKSTPFDQIVSLTMHNKTTWDILKQCSALRSLKLIGDFEWVVLVLRNCRQRNIRLEQLVIVMAGIKPLFELLKYIFCINSLHRLVICADEVEEKVKISTLLNIQSKIEQFILHTCSPISWDELAYMQPGLIHVRLLEINLFHYCKTACHSSFNFPYLRSLRISLLEVPFQWIIQLVAVMPSLVKLKLAGLVDDENFTIAHKWLHLLNSVPTLAKIAINISLDLSDPTFRYEERQMTLGNINLSLTHTVDDFEYHLSEVNKQRWWQLVGAIYKHD